jgi:hypothetical protein
MILLIDLINSKPETIKFTPFIFTRGFQNMSQTDSTVGGTSIQAEIEIFSQYFHHEQLEQQDIV